MLGIVPCGRPVGSRGNGPAVVSQRPALWDPSPPALCGSGQYTWSNTRSRRVVVGFTTM